MNIFERNMCLNEDIFREKERDGTKISPSPSTSYFYQDVEQEKKGEYKKILVNLAFKQKKHIPPELFLKMCSLFYFEKM